MEIVVLGNDDFVTGFLLSGVRKVVVSSEKKLDSEVEKIVSDPNAGILVLEQECFDNLSHLTRRKLNKILPPVVVTVSKDRKESDIRQLIKRSIGVDLWKD